MKVKFMIKNRRVSAPVCASKPEHPVVEVKEEVKPSSGGAKNKKSKKGKAMDFDQIEMLASELTQDQTTKRIKKDKGLIERTESSKIMITEDNKMLLTD